MAITSGFFDSVNGDRTYDADQMSNYFDGLVSDGVYETVGEKFLVTANTGMTLNVGSGRAIIQSRWVKNDETEVLTLDPSDVQLNRIDAVVLRLDKGARTITLTVKKGTAVSGTPTMPDITRTESVYELYLASVYIGKGATQPTTITDLRPSSYCGWVTGIVQQVDTSDLFLQWQTAYEQQFAEFDAYIAAKQEAFNEWFIALTQQLKVEAGLTKLQWRAVVSAGSNGTQIPDDYNEATDVLLIFCNGVFYAENYDYTIKTMPPYNHRYMRLLNKPSFGESTEITFVVLRTVIGQSVITGSLPKMSVNAVKPLSAGVFLTFDMGGTQNVDSEN